MSFFEFPHTRTYDSDLGWLIKDYKTLDELIAAIKSWIEETQPTINELLELYNNILKGDFPDSIKDGLYIWMKENASNIMTELVQMVFFGVTNDGYFVAYIPEGWDFLTFGTSGLDDFPVGVDFGHLTLSY